MSRHHVGRSRVAALAAAVLVWLVLAGCGDVVTNLPQPAPEPGYYAFAFERIATPRINAAGDGAALGDVWTVSVWDGPITSSDVRIEPTGRQGVLRVGDTLYVEAEFELHNDGDAPLERMALLGYRHEAFRVASAISQPFIGGSRVAPDVLVRDVTPTNRMVFESAFLDAGEALRSHPTDGHFIALRESDVPNAAGPAGFLGVLPYGFIVGGGATIASGDSSLVWLSFTIPLSPQFTNHISGFVWNAVLLTAPDVRVTQASPERHARGWAGTLERAERVGATRIVAIGAGVRQVPAGVACDLLVGLADVRIAGSSSADEAYIGLIEAASVEAPVFTGCEGASP